MIQLKKAIKTTRSIGIALSLLVFVTTAFADHKPPVMANPIPSAPGLSSNAYVLMDFHSQQVLSEKNSQQRVEPASLTKMMTMYVIDSEIKNANLKLSDKVKISKKAWSTQGSRMFLEVNTEVTVEKLIRGIIVQSGNDACVALAEHLTGSEGAFVDLMNTYAARLGMKDSHFVNVSGLPHPDHYTTAHDMTLLSKAIIRDFPDSYSIYSEKSFEHNGIKQINRNRLLWRNSAVDGIKTGHTDSAGYCIAASAKRQDMRLLAIVMGAKNDEVRTNEANRLLTWGFRFFETHKLYDASESLQETRIWMGKKKTLDLGLENDVYITVAQGQYPNLHASINVSKVIKAPLEEGKEVGTFSVTLNGETLTEQPLVALDTVPRGDWFKRGYDFVALSLHSLFDNFKL